MLSLQVSYNIHIVITLFFPDSCDFIWHIPPQAGEMQFIASYIWPSCCPRSSASWLLTKWKENCGPTRQTRRKSPEVVVIGGKQTFSVRPQLSSRLVSSASVDWSWSTRLRSYWREYQQLAYVQLCKTLHHLNAEPLVVSKTFPVIETIKHSDLHHIKESFQFHRSSLFCTHWTCSFPT